MTEPSQEAVELALGMKGIASGMSAVASWLESNYDPATSGGRLAQALRADVAVMVELERETLPAALRALEQRTRLETLERAAKLICVRWCGEGLKPRKSKHPDGSWEHPGEGAYGFPGYCAATPFWSEIASLQPREAPKAEEPEWVKPEEKCACDFHSSHVFCRSPMCTCVAPQPGPKEGR